jgi:hypothetical protein
MTAFSAAFLIHFVVAGGIQTTLASVNLMLPIQETQKLLGLTRELSYIRDGVLNNGAVGFKIPISTDLDSLHFVWWNSDITYNVKYKIIVKILHEPDTMFQPSLNISHSGQVPKTPTFWRMSLKCNHLHKGQVPIEIHFDIGTDIKFTLLREKYCDNSENSNGLPNNINSDDSTNISSHLVFIYSLLVAFFIALTLGVTVVVVQKKSTNLNNSSNLHQACADNVDPSPLLLPNPHQQQEPSQQHHQIVLQRPHAQFRAAAAVPQPPPSNNPGYSVYDAGMTSDAESRVTDWIQQQYMKQVQVSKNHLNKL